MIGDEHGAGVGVGRAQDSSYLREWDVELAQGRRTPPPRTFTSTAVVVDEDDTFRDTEEVLDFLRNAGGVLIDEMVIAP